METEDEMEDFTYYNEPFEDDDDEFIDFDYEFDAPFYFDFTQPESDKEALLAQTWFNFASTYPPSPFVLKLNREIEARAECIAVELEDGRNMHPVGANQKDCEASENNFEVKMKSPVKFLSRNSTLMKPTASYLAKQNRSREVHSNMLLQRYQLSLGNSTEASSRRSSLNENPSQSTKRQKLEAGYLSKTPQVKHQTSLLHKLPKKAGLPEVNSAVTRIKYTIPKEPNLETARRAQRYRSKFNHTSSERSNDFNFKARPLNRKILEAPTLLPPKKSIPQMPEFQVFHLKTLERAKLHISSDVVNSPYVSSSRKGIRRLNSLHDTKQDKCVKAEQSKAQPFDKMLLNNEESGAYLNVKDSSTVSGEFNCQAHKTFSDEPPTELLSKLSLSSECRHCSKFHGKIHFRSNCSKENLPSFLDQENEVMNIFVQNSSWRIAKQCLLK